MVCPLRSENQTEQTNNGKVALPSPLNSDLAASLMLKIMVIHSNIATGHK
jgi:hypothetical protein